MFLILSRLDRVLVAANGFVIVALLGAMACIVFANVTLRFLTSESLVWAEEVARYLMIWMTFLGAGLALRRGLHVAVGGVQQALPARAGLVLRGVVVALMLAFFGLMVWTGMDYMDRMGRQVTPATRISFKWIYAAMPVGFALLVLHMAFALPVWLRTGRFESVSAPPDAPLAG